MRAATEKGPFAPHRRSFHRLNENDISPEIGELLAAILSSQSGEIENADPRERRRRSAYGCVRGAPDLAPLPDPRRDCGVIHRTWPRCGSSYDQRSVPV